MPSIKVYRVQVNKCQIITIIYNNTIYNNIYNRWQYTITYTIDDKFFSCYCWMNETE